MEKEKAENKKTKKKIYKALHKSSFSSPRSLANSYLKNHIIKSKDLELPKERKYNINDKFDKLAIKNIYKRLSRKTKDELKMNYNNLIIKEILEALSNFESPILISYNVSKLSNEMKKDSLHKIKELGKTKRHIDLLMKNELIANIEPIKESLIILRKEIEKNLKKFKTMKTNGVGLAKLYGMLLDPMSTSYFLLYDTETYFKEIPFLIPEQQKGRPKKIFLKALQIIIYSLLTSKPPKAKKRYNQWAKELTATIINDFFDRWRSPSFYNKAAPDSGVGILYKTFGPLKVSKLTAKDVDNSLRSS